MAPISRGMVRSHRPGRGAHQPRDGVTLAPRRAQLRTALTAFERRQGAGLEDASAAMRGPTWTGFASMLGFLLDSAPPQADAVVLVHGLVVSCRYFMPLACELASDFRVHAPDLPGSV